MSTDFSPVDKSCPNCGGNAAADSRFCRHCGFNFAEPVPPSPAAEPPAGGAANKTRYALLAVGLALTLTLAVGGVFIYKSRRNAASSAAPSQTMGQNAQRLEERIVRGEALTAADLAGLTSYELRVLRNAHFAKYGRSYDRPGLGDYFYTRSWYQPNAAYNDGLLTATDKANISLILPEENRVKAAEAAAAASAPPPDTSVAGSLFSSGSSLTTDNVQRAVDQILDWTKKGGGVRVLGIQELPQQNQAKADIRFEDFQYNSTDMGTPVSKDKVTPPQPNINSPNYWAEAAAYVNNQVKVTRYSGEGVGILKHYNDGRWVLTSVHFNFVGVNGAVTIQ